MDGGKQFTGQTGFPTPTSIPDETGCRTLTIPASTEWFSLFMGCLDAMRLPFLWYQTIGGITQDEAAEAASAILDDAYALAETGSCTREVQTPYWDDATDVDTDEPAETQEWYGEVSNPTAPADELDFVENLLVWTFTGLVALATPELGFAPAIAFHTIAPKFLLAQKAGDIAEIWRIVVDGQDVASIDTTGRAGEIIEVPVVPDPALDSHDILLLSTLA